MTELLEACALLPLFWKFWRENNFFIIICNWKPHSGWSFTWIQNVSNRLRRLTGWKTFVILFLFQRFALGSQLFFQLSLGFYFQRFFLLHIFLFCGTFGKHTLVSSTKDFVLALAGTPCSKPRMSLVSPRTRTFTSMRPRTHWKYGCW